MNTNHDTFTNMEIVQCSISQNVEAGWLLEQQCQKLSSCYLSPKLLKPSWPKSGMKRPIGGGPMGPPCIGPGPIIMGPGMPCIIGYGPIGIMGNGPIGGKWGRKGGPPIGPDIPMDMARLPLIFPGGPSMGRIPEGGRMNPGPFGGALVVGGPGPFPMPGFGGLGPVPGGLPGGGLGP